MSTWSCPSCSREVSSYEVSCECGFTRAELELPPVSQAALSRRLSPPVAPFRWLARSLVILRIWAYIALVCSAIVFVSALFDALTLPLDAPEGVATALLLRALVVGAVGALSFALTLGLVDAGKMLQAIHRRLGALDEHERAGP